MTSSFSSSSSSFESTPLFSTPLPRPVSGGFHTSRGPLPGGGVWTTTSSCPTLPSEWTTSSSSPSPSLGLTMTSPEPKAWAPLGKSVLPVHEVVSISLKYYKTHPTEAIVRFVSGPSHEAEFYPGQIPEEEIESFLRLKSGFQGKLGRMPPPEKEKEDEFLFFPLNSQKDYAVLIACCSSAIQDLLSPEAKIQKRQVDRIMKFLLARSLGLITGSRPAHSVEADSIPDRTVRMVNTLNRFLTEEQKGKESSLSQEVHEAFPSPKKEEKDEDEEETSTVMVEEEQESKEDANKP